MTPNDDVKAACEREHGTEHLPATVRDILYQHARALGHSPGYQNGADDILHCYGDFSEVALAAWDASREAEQKCLASMLESRGRHLASRGYDGHGDALIRTAELIKAGRL